MTEGDAPDWFGGRTPAEPHGPRQVGEAFGHLRKADAGEGSDWFESQAAAESAAEPAGTAVAAASDWFAAAAAEPALAAAEPAEIAEPAESSTAEPAENAAPTADPDPGSEPDTDPRVRLRALTGGLADLSDAMAAIGVESVALRNPGPARPAAPQPVPAADFRVRCPDCGPQFVAIADLRFVETGDGAEANRYLFTCPACGARVRRPAGPELAEILKSSGVATLALRRGPGQAL